MAFGGITLVAYHANGNGAVAVDAASSTFQDVLNVIKTGQESGHVRPGYTFVLGTGQEIGLSLTEGGAPLTLSSLVTSVFPDDSGGDIYALYPEPETITGFYLDGTEYKFEGGGSGGIQNDTTGTTSTVTKIRAGSKAEYNALSSKDATTIYHVF